MQVFRVGDKVWFKDSTYGHWQAGFVTQLEPLLVTDAPVQIALEVRSGRDDTPLVHHLTMEIGEEKEVSEAEYERAPSGDRVNLTVSYAAPQGRVPRPLRDRGTSTRANLTT